MCLDFPIVSFFLLGPISGFFVPKNPNPIDD